ncbi:MAG: DoxX family protein [Candidatus Marinimicrobia bacterium]|nr:DoxX family protein [Candidatus Neomarinimicrobiota bacterium]|tara:strand:- start:59919 stop:60377 length:459 start_codon:yes stop_codon:yes gene_type:complete
MDILLIIDSQHHQNYIELFGLKMKNSLILCQILIALMMSITFIQSGLDKIINRKGNVEFFLSHFENTPLKSVSNISLSILTMLEMMGGVICIYGVYYVIVEKSSIWIFYGLILNAITILILFFGQRVAKDYIGAADLVPYFILNILGIMIIY